MKALFTSCGLGMILVGCSTPTDTSQVVSAMGNSYLAAAEAEGVLLPLLSPSDAATLHSLDNAAYSLIQPLVAAEAAGATPTEVQLAAAQSALATFVQFEQSKKGATP